jgi:hypothetical protein
MWKEVFPLSKVKNFFQKKSNMTPLNFVKIVFQNFILLSAPELFFYPFSRTRSNSVKLILSVRGTTFSLYSVLAELRFAYTEYTGIS